MAEQNPLEAFRLALAGATRAIAHEPEVELGYSADAAIQSGKTVKVPMPGRTLPADQVAEARGAADAFALRLRLHDAALHNRTAPSEPVARAVFDAVEQARVEALGSRGMEGITANLATALEAKMRADPIARARNREEVPLSTAIGLMVRERLTGQPVPERAKAGLEMVRDWVEEKAGADLDGLNLALDDQKAFAQLATKMLQDLQLMSADVPPEYEPEEGDEEDEGEDQNEGETDDEREGEGAGAQDRMEVRAEADEGESDEQDEGEAERDSMAEEDGGLGDDAEEGAAPARPNRPFSDLSPDRKSVV